MNCFLNSFLWCHYLSHSVHPQHGTDHLLSFSSWDANLKKLRLPLRQGKNMKAFINANLARLLLSLAVKSSFTFEKTCVIRKQVYLFPKFYFPQFAWQITEGLRSYTSFLDKDLIDECDKINFRTGYLPINFTLLLCNNLFLSGPFCRSVNRLLWPLEVRQWSTRNTFSVWTRCMGHQQNKLSTH